MLQELKGRAKEKGGEITDNPTLAAEGPVEKLAGKLQKKPARLNGYWMK